VTAGRDIVVANAAAALVAAGVARSFAEGAQLAGTALASGAAREKLAALVWRYAWSEGHRAIRWRRTTYRSRTAADSRVVHGIGRTCSGKHVGSFVADVTHGDVKSRGHLALKGGIPLINRWKPLNPRTDIGGSRTVGPEQRQITIRIQVAYKIRKWVCWRAGSKVENRTAIISVRGVNV